MFDLFRRKRRKNSERTTGTVLDFLYRAMQIDDAWSVREAMGFTWWAYNLAQRVWAEPARLVGGHRVLCFRVQTDVFREVTNPDAVAVATQGWNYQASVSGFVFDKAQGTVKLTCSMVCDEENIEQLQGLLAGAMALQCAEAHAAAEWAAEPLGCKADISNHPGNGPRPMPDDMLRIREELIVPHGAAPAPFSEESFRNAIPVLEELFGGGPSGPIRMAAADRGLIAEPPFWANIPGGAQRHVYGRVPQEVNCWLYVSADIEHPGYGSGLFLLLRLPVDLELKACTELVRQLNLAEATEPVWFSQLGAWCVGGEKLQPHFVGFVPSAITRPHQLVWLIQQMFARSFWARDVVRDRFGIGFELAPELLEMLPA